jgi:hypothetical protein
MEFFFDGQVFQFGTSPNWAEKGENVPRGTFPILILASKLFHVEHLHGTLFCSSANTIFSRPLHQKILCAGISLEKVRPWTFRVRAIGIYTRSTALQAAEKGLIPSEKAKSLPPGLNRLRRRANNERKALKTSLRG